MINTFTASPKKINDIDMSKLGEGTGVTRYAAGMYFGGPSTVEHYLATYKTYNDTDKVFYKHGVEVPEEAAGYPVMLYLSNNRYSKSAAFEHYHNDPEALAMLDLMFDGNEINFTVESGVCHEVRLNGINEDEAVLWTETVSEVLLEQVAQKFYADVLTEEKLGSIDYEALEMEPDYVSDYETLVDEAFDAAFLKAQEDSVLSPADEEGLRAMWQAQARGDTIFSNQREDSFYEHLYHSPQWEMLSKTLNSNVSVHVEMSHGDLYEHLSSLFSPEPNITGEHSVMKGKLRASEFFSKQLKIPAFKCESMYGLDNSMEIIVMDEQILKDSKFEPITHQEFLEHVEMEVVPLHTEKYEDDMDQEYSPHFRNGY